MMRVALAATAVAVVTGFVFSLPASPSIAPRERVPDVVARALPAVVSITTRQIGQDQFNRSTVTRGLGSGIVVDGRGYVLTNAHVVEGAAEIKVSLTDGRKFTARLVGIDGPGELGVLRIEGSRLPALALGDSSRLRPGQPVIAIGNPLWIEGGPTVTTGVVSGLGRSMEQDGLPVLHGLIQTDAAINPGNSGGPLLDLDGRVIGINTATIPSAHGIGFAIAADTVRPVLRALMAGEHLVRPSLAVVAVSLTPQVAWANDLPIERGAMVTRVAAGGPAAAAGVQPDDVITAVEGQPIQDLHELHQALARHGIGRAIAVTVWRAGRTLVLRPVPEEER